MMKEVEDVEDFGGLKSAARHNAALGSSSNHAPRTNSSDRLFKGMMLIVAFGFILMIFSAISTAPLTSSNGGGGVGGDRPLYSTRIHQQEELLRDFKQGRRPRQQKHQQARQHQPQSDNDNQSHPPYHMVFSTSCNDQQHWESYVFFYHANKVGQLGTVTRICSGCSESEGIALQAFHEEHIRPMNENFHLHLTPDFGALTRKQKVGDQKSYKYMNKPYGLKHWMDSVLKMNDTAHAPSVEDGIVFLLDPDMILLRPLVHDFTDEDVLWVTEKDKEPETKVVKHGYPIAQQDGYLSNQWMGLNASFIMDGGNIDHIHSRDGPLYWNTGPPYLATVKDMYNIACLWCDYAPRVYHVHPKLFGTWCWMSIKLVSFLFGVFLCSILHCHQKVH
jgi:hypothetical protein